MRNLLKIFSREGVGKMFQIGPGEWLLILLVIIILFGANKIPELARALGKAKKEFKRGLEEGEKEEEKKEKSEKE